MIVEVKLSTSLTGYKAWNTYIKNINVWFPNRGHGPSVITADGRKHWGMSKDQEPL